MNSPLRYGGETYYQASFEPGDKVSILQVVHNPAAATPYVACALICVGLLAQFLTHLFGFARRGASPSQLVPARSEVPAHLVEPMIEAERSEA